MTINTKIKEIISKIELLNSELLTEYTNDTTDIKDNEIYIQLKNARLMGLAFIRNILNQYKTEFGYEKTNKQEIYNLYAILNFKTEKKKEIISKLEETIIILEKSKTDILKRETKRFEETKEIKNNLQQRIKEKIQEDNNIKYDKFLLQNIEFDVCISKNETIKDNNEVFEKQNKKKYAVDSVYSRILNRKKTKHLNDSILNEITVNKLEETHELEEIHELEETHELQETHELDDEQIEQDEDLKKQEKQEEQTREKEDKEEEDENDIEEIIINDNQSVIDDEEQIKNEKCKIDLLNDYRKLLSDFGFEFDNIYYNKLKIEPYII